MKTQRGFTLVELMIVIAIIGIIAAVAIPSIRDMTAANRQLAASSAIVAAFNNARNSAITLSRDVTIYAPSGNWANGWTVETVSTQVLALDGTVGPSNVDPLSQHDALPAQITVTAALTSFQYDREGRLNIGAAQTITICDDRTGETGRQITLNPIGNLTVTSVTCG